MTPITSTDTAVADVAETSGCTNNKIQSMASAAGTARADCSDAGPRYCHFDLTDETVDFSMALRDALLAIGRSVVSCTYTIPPNPDGVFDPSLINVRLVDDAGLEEVIPQGASGWSYSGDMLRVELSPAVAAFTMPVTEIDAESPTWAFTQVFLTCSVPCLRVFV